MTTLTEAKEEAIHLLRTNELFLERFEAAYRDAKLKEVPSLNLFDANAKDIVRETRRVSSKKIDDIMGRIVEELMAVYEGKALPDNLVTNGEITLLPKEVRPQLTGTLAKVDVEEPSCYMLLYQYSRFLKETDPKQKMRSYHMFRQGLDILDLDSITYEMLGKNRNTMGYWFPKLQKALEGNTFFKVPETKIVKVPLPVLQLTRLDFFELTQTTRDIVNRFCMKAFNLDTSKKYFIKTGVTSSKYDFRNAKICSPKEVAEIGEYFLFLHFQASQMASPLSVPVIYGAATTNEWVVREYIDDVENNLTIYHGLPLHTEFRVFVDCDKDIIMGIAPYWEPSVMKNKFEASDSLDMVHDYVSYCAHEPLLMKRYEENKERVQSEVEKILPALQLKGQWSIDIMKNGDDFYIIDMATADTSALKECIPANLLKKSPEDWIPRIQTKY